MRDNTKKKEQNIVCTRIVRSFSALSFALFEVSPPTGSILFQTPIGIKTFMLLA